METRSIGAHGFSGFSSQPGDSMAVPVVRQYIRVAGVCVMEDRSSRGIQEVKSLHILQRSKKGSSQQESSYLFSF